MGMPEGVSKKVDNSDFPARGKSGLVRDPEKKRKTRNLRKGLDQGFNRTALGVSIA